MTDPTGLPDTETGDFEGADEIRASETRPLPEITIQPFAADDPEWLPRSRGALPGDADGSATAELLHLYTELADAAEQLALGPSEPHAPTMSAWQAGPTAGTD